MGVVTKRLASAGADPERLQLPETGPHHHFAGPPTAAPRATALPTTTARRRVELWYRHLWDFMAVITCCPLSMMGPVFVRTFIGCSCPQHEA